MATQTQTALDVSIPSIVAPDKATVFPRATPQSQSRQSLASITSPLNVEDDNTNTTAAATTASTAKNISTLQKVSVTFQLSGINFASSATNGLIVIGLPAIAHDLNLPDHLAFWPSSVGSLATAATLLLAGSLADVLGPRSIDLLGCVVTGALMLGCGFVRTGEELVGLRAVYGVGYAMHLASSVALVTKIMARGRARNLSFACLGLSQPLGFSFGLVVGGVLVDTIGWRAAWYIYGGITLLLTAMGIFTLPKSESLGTWTATAQALKTKVDWVGALLASVVMSLLSYFLAVISTDIGQIRQTTTIIFLCLGTLAVPLFAFWMHRQVKIRKPALIPNYLWRNVAFPCICAVTAMSFAVVNSLELFSSLFFQEIQHLSALQAAIRILPSLVVGIIMNLSCGFFVDKIPAIWIVVGSSLLTAIAPVLMAVIQAHWPYWANAFVAQLLMPISADVLFTVGLLIITDTFPEDKQALAGGVFNVAAQFGTSFGLAMMQVVSTLVTKGQEGTSPVQALMEGYRASFWTMFGLMIACAVVGWMGLRKKGKIGLKDD